VVYITLLIHMLDPTTAEDLEDLSITALTIARSRLTTRGE